MFKCNCNDYRPKLNKNIFTDDTVAIYLKGKTKDFLLQGI